MLPVRVPLHLRLVSASLAKKGRPRCCAGLKRPESWSQILVIWTLWVRCGGSGELMLSGGSVAAAVYEGIEAVVQFVSLASESIGSGLCRRWIGHYRGRAGVGCARKTFYFRTSRGWCADYGQPAVGFSRRGEAQS
jgi:hypothetical protein